MVTELSPFLATLRQVTSYPEMKMATQMTTTPTKHRHDKVATHVIVQRAGIPYELERVVCSVCGRVLDERPLHRAAA